MKNIMSLPFEARYLCINDVRKQFCHENVKSTAAAIGCAQNTVRSAMSYCEHSTILGHQGRTKKLKKHHYTHTWTNAIAFALRATLHSVLYSLLSRLQASPYRAFNDLGSCVILFDVS